MDFESRFFDTSVMRETIKPNTRSPTLSDNPKPQSGRVTPDPSADFLINKTIN
jgi:hypothetical protein